MDEYDDLIMARQAFPKVDQTHLWFFSKSGYTKPVMERARREGTLLLGLDDLFAL